MVAVRFCGRATRRPNRDIGRGCDIGRRDGRDLRAAVHREARWRITRQRYRGRTREIRTRYHNRLPARGGANRGRERSDGWNSVISEGIGERHRRA